MLRVLVDQANAGKSQVCDGFLEHGPDAGIGHGGNELEPGRLCRQNPRRFIKSDIIDKVLLRDLPILYGISDIQELNSLFNTLAYNTGQELSLEDLSKTANVAKNTLVKNLE